RCRRYSSRSAWSGIAVSSGRTGERPSRAACSRRKIPAGVLDHIGNGYWLTSKAPSPVAFPPLGAAKAPWRCCAVLAHLVGMPSKFPVDVKFLTTAAATFALIVVVVAVLNLFAGLPAASVAASVLGAVAVKLFDKLDYNPSFAVEFGAPKISAPWLYSAVAASFIVYGSSVGADVASALLNRVLVPAQVCTLWPLVGVSALDWGGLVLAGWVVGRLFP